MHCWFLIGEVLHLLQAMSRWEIRTAVLVCGWEGYRTLTMLTYTFKNMDLLLRDVTLLARRAVSAAGSPTRPARRRPTAHRQRYRRRRQTTTNTSQRNNTCPLGGPVITLTVSDDDHIH